MRERERERERERLHVINYIYKDQPRGQLTATEAK